APDFNPGWGWRSVGLLTTVGERPRLQILQRACQLLPPLPRSAEPQQLLFHRRETLQLAGVQRPVESLPVDDLDGDHDVLPVTPGGQGGVENADLEVAVFSLLRQDPARQLVQARVDLPEFRGAGDRTRVGLLVAPEQPETESDLPPLGPADVVLGPGVPADLVPLDAVAELQLFPRFRVGRRGRLHPLDWGSMVPRFVPHGLQPP